MGYRNKTYVIFDGDNDIWAYRFMRGWKASEHMDFDFYDAHDLVNLSDSASEERVKNVLRERLGNTKQAIVLIGENTKNLYRFVRWEMESCINRDVPMIAVNLNDKRARDDVLCPAIIRETYTVHLPFKAKAIQYALDNFPDEYFRRNKGDTGPRLYPDAVYRNLGL